MPPRLCKSERHVCETNGLHRDGTESAVVPGHNAPAVTGYRTALLPVYDAARWWAQKWAGYTTYLLTD